METSDPILSTKRRFGYFESLWCLCLFCNFYNNGKQKVVAKLLPVMYNHLHVLSEFIMTICKLSLPLRLDTIFYSMEFSVFVHPSQLISVVSDPPLWDFDTK